MGAAVLSISQLRQEVAGLLTGAGVKTYAKAPTAFSAPGAVIDFDDPIITFGETFGSCTVHLNLYFMVNPSPKWEDEVTAMIGKAIQALQGTSISFGNVSMYDTLEISGTARVFKGAVINLATEVAIKEMN